MEDNLKREFIISVTATLSCKMKTETITDSSDKYYFDSKSIIQSTLLKPSYIFKKCEKLGKRFGLKDLTIEDVISAIGVFGHAKCWDKDGNILGVAFQDNFIDEIYTE